MKKILLIVGILIVLILAAAITLPIIFKDDIKVQVERQVNESVNAEVSFSDFGLSLFRNFPGATASLYDFSIVNKEPFAGDTLLAAKSLRVAVNLWSLISGDQIRIDKIELNDPSATIIVLEDGTANYDIALEEETPEAGEDSLEFSVGVDKWVIHNGKIAYADLSTKLLLKLDGVYHEGRGDFTQDIFDMKTYSKVNSFGFNYDGIDYVSDKYLEADVELNMNMPDFRFTFKDNEVKLNDFSFGFEGWMAMPHDDIEMDIVFASRENTFKSLLSLVPGMYQDEFENVRAEGSIAFNGFVKGVYNDSTEKMPAVNLNLLVEDGSFQYPDLPRTASNVRVDLLVNVPEGNPGQAVINLKKFHMDIGENPVDATFLLEGLETMKIAADIDAIVNLADIVELVPMEGLELKGLLTANVRADGVYDSASSRFPKVEGTMSLQNGYVKSKEFPSAIDNIRFTARAANPNGQMKETEIHVNDFAMSLDGDRFTADMYLKDLDNYTWDVSAMGAVDLEKVARIMDLKDMTLKGKISADIQTKGQMADVEAERYDRLPTSGTMSVSNFYFESQDLPQGFTINKASLAFNPNRMQLTEFTGAAGGSDLAMNGYLSNYLGYFLREDEVIKGELNLHSGEFNVNEWMTDEEADERDTMELEVIEIPKNIDLALNSTIDQLIYDNLTLNDMKGRMTVREGRLNLDNLRFNLLGGRFLMSGYYDTENPAKPAFDFRFDVEELSVKQAYQNFNTVQALAPVAQHVEGGFSTNFSLRGNLQPNMTPDLGSLSGQGLILLADAALQDSKIISGITSLTSQAKTDKLSLKDIRLNAEIKDGRLHVKPFNFNLGNIEATASGSNGLNGDVDYIVGMNIPSGQLGQSINEAIASLGGPKEAVGETIKLNVKIAGDYNDPKVSLASTERSEEGGAAAGARETVKGKIEAEKETLKEEAGEQIEETKQEVQKEIDEQKEKAKEEVMKEVDRAKDRLRKLFR